MTDWASEQDTVDNTVPAIQHYYGTKYGDEEHSCPGCPEGADSSDKEKQEPEKVSFSNSQGPMEEHNVGFNKGRGAGGDMVGSPDKEGGSSRRAASGSGKGSTTGQKDTQSGKAGQKEQAWYEKAWNSIKNLSFWPKKKTGETEEK